MSAPFTRLSIIVPAYNEEKVIERTLVTILAGGHGLLLAGRLCACDCGPFSYMLLAGVVGWDQTGLFPWNRTNVPEYSWCDVALRGRRMVRTPTTEGL